jgi:DNA replication protein DnaC
MNKEEFEKEQKHDLFIGRVKSSNMPKRYRKASLRKLDNRHDKTNIEKVVKYADGFMDILDTGDFLLFNGMNGSGKTHIACAIANRIMYKHEKYVQYVNLIDIFMRIKGSWGKGSTETEIDILSSYITPSLLILDEIGVQYKTENELIIMQTLINKRYEDLKPTILISNLTLDEINNLLGKRIMRRVSEHGQFLKFGG